MIIMLQPLPPLAGPLGDGYHGKVPARALFMRPEAARALLLVERDTGGLVYTDILRSAMAILAAHRAKAGTMPAAFSFHGYGGCVDADIAASCARAGLDYAGLCAAFERRGFFCHRRDGSKDGSEAWHFNYLGDDGPALIAATTDEHKTWEQPAEAMIQKWYGDQMAIQMAALPDALRAAGCISVEEFQRDWDLAPDGIAGPITQRVLAFVTAQTVNVSPAPSV